MHKVIPAPWQFEGADMAASRDRPDAKQVLPNLLTLVNLSSIDFA